MVICIYGMVWLFWSERVACTAFGRCRQNEVASINGFSLISDQVTTLPEGVVLGF